MIQIGCPCSEGYNILTWSWWRATFIIIATYATYKHTLLNVLGTTQCVGIGKSWSNSESPPPTPPLVYKNLAICVKVMKLFINILPSSYEGCVLATHLHKVDCCIDSSWVMFSGMSSLTTLNGMCMVALTLRICPIDLLSMHSCDIQK